MSIPAFVIDANQRPLLPTTPAYARVLLRDGKAQRIPHPALALIQLSHAIDAPQMPPVLVGIMVHEEGWAKHKIRVTPRRQLICPPLSRAQQRYLP